MQCVRRIALILPGLAWFTASFVNSSPVAAASVGLTIRATPAAGLEYGALAVVNGRDPSDLIRSVWQCALDARATDTGCDPNNWTAALTRTRGAFSTTFAVESTFETTNGRKVDCRVDRCELGAAGLRPSPAGMLAEPLIATHPISFARSDHPQRFVDAVFAGVKVTRNLVYVRRAALPLRLDLYQPVHDTLPSRPLIVWIHGGGYQLGQKEDLDALARTWARRGYVAATIDYRLAPGTDATNPAIAQAIDDAAQDASSSVEWLVVRSTEYHIDRDAVIVAGISAGAATALELATHPLPSMPPVAVALSISGAIPSATPLHRTSTAVLMFNGTLDHINPLTRADHDCERIRASGQNCQLVSYDGQGHGLSQLQSNIDTVSIHFLVADHLVVPRPLDAPGPPPAAARHKGAAAGASQVVLVGCIVAAIGLLMWHRRRSRHQKKRESVSTR